MKHRLVAAAAVSAIALMVAAGGQAAGQAPLTRCSFTLVYGASSGETITVVGRHLTEQSLRRVCESMALNYSIAQDTRPIYGGPAQQGGVRRCAFVSDDPLPRGYTGKRVKRVNGEIVKVNGRPVIESYPVGQGPVVFTLYSGDVTSDPIACSRLGKNLAAKMPSLRQVA